MIPEPTTALLLACGLVQRPGVGLLLGDGYGSRRGQPEPGVVPAAEEGSDGRCASAQAPQCTPHLGDPCPPGGEEHPVGGGSARPRGPRPHAPCLRSCDPGGRVGRELRGLRRTQRHYPAPGSGEPSREIVPAGRNRAKTLAPPARLERATPGLGNRCSIHLSYGGAGRKAIRNRDLARPPPAPPSTCSDRCLPRVCQHSRGRRPRSFAPSRAITSARGARAGAADPPATMPTGAERVVGRSVATGYTARLNAATPTFNEHATAPAPSTPRIRMKA